MGRGWCRWKCIISPEVRLALILEIATCMLCQCAIHVSGPKYVFRLVGMFSKLARRHEARIVSVEPQNIPEVHSTRILEIAAVMLCKCAIRGFGAEISVLFGPNVLKTGAST